MWLADRSSPSALASASEYLRVNQLRARIKKRSHKYRDILTLRLVKKTNRKRPYTEKTPI